MDPKTIGLHTLRARNARYFAGTNFSPCRRYVSGVLLRVSDRGLDAAFQAVHQLNVRVPREVRQRLAEITGQVGHPADLCEAARYVAELQIVNIERLLHDAGTDPMNLVAIGQTGSDLWSHSESLGRTVMPLGCPQLLAEATGVSVIDRFHERDIAAGGTGGPLESLLLWLLLTQAKDSNSERPQVVVVLDETLEMFHLPPRRRGRDVPSIAWLDLGAGYGLLDQVATEGEASHETNLMPLTAYLQAQEIQTDWTPPTTVTQQAVEALLSAWAATEPRPTFADCERAAFPIWIERIREGLENLFPRHPQPSR
ncbi:MAG: anhydro-N-acetylmuramic acid kinase, partial [Pirellulaceae bacterium]